MLKAQFKSFYRFFKQFFLFYFVQMAIMNYLLMENPFYSRTLFKYMKKFEKSYWESYAQAQTIESRLIQQLWMSSTGINLALQFIHQNGFEQKLASILQIVFKLESLNMKNRPCFASFWKRGIYGVL